MKKILIGIVLTVIVIMAAGYFIYRHYLPEFVASTLSSEKLPPYLPKHVQTKIEEFRAPVNKGTEEMVKEIHRANVPIEKVYETIDNTTDEQAYALLDELNNTPLKNTDHVFDIIKKHIPANFNVEVFRRPFTEHFNMKMVRKALYYGEKNRKSKDLDVDFAKAIIKQVLKEKDKEIRSGETETTARN